ncbi:MAG TPA: type II secretion system F family protein [Thermoplasmata archaeon]|nr:type II secretion system F family protein [Thermoplasmata archaeon]
MSRVFEPTPTAAGDSGKSGAPKKSAGAPPVSRYRSFCYGLFGERYDREGRGAALGDRLKQAGFNTTPGMHLAVATMTTVIAAAVVCTFSLVLFLILIHGVAYWYGYVALVTLVTVGAVQLGFGSIITTRIANRKDQLDRELPFTLSELSVLASTGTSPVQLIRRMASRDHDLAMTGEFKRVVYKIDLEGKDLITALAETAKESPSTSVREAFWDLGNMIHQGGNLDEYLRAKSDDVLKLKRAAQKQFIERLQAFIDMYVSMVLVGVLMLAVAAFLLNSLGQTAAGLNANELLLLLTFGLVPLAVIVTVVMISIAYNRAE